LRAFPNDDSEEKPTLESFGVTGDRPVHSFETIISKIEEIEKRVSDRWYGNSNDNLNNFKIQKDSLIRMLTSHEVHVNLFVCPACLLYECVSGCVSLNDLLQVHLILGAYKDSTSGNFVRKIFQGDEIISPETEEVFWAGLRHQSLTRFYTFSHSIFFDSSNDSYNTVGKKIILKS
jgi:hypothetical protein